MTPDDGEEDDAPLGPPPDPSLRQWRHPSEIASANAAALRDLSPAPRARWRSFSFLGGCAIGLIGVVVLGTAVARPFTGGSDDVDDATLLATSAPIWSPDGDDATPTTSHDGDEDGHESDDDSTTSTTATATTTQVLVSSTLPPTLEAGASGVVALLDADDHSLVATGLVVDGMVLTSAHELGGRSEVLIATGADEGLAGLVAGSDPFSDLAVVATLDPDLLPEPVRLASTDDDVTMTPGSTVWILAASGQTTPTAVGGELSATDQDVMTSSGDMVFDALQTTIRTPVHGPGGAVVDDRGNTIAMVIACDRHLASALPIESLRATAHTIRETGWAHIGWLGIEGEGVDDGIVLQSVEPGGPAAVAGLAAGDVLLSVDGEPLQHLAGIVQAIRRAGVGNQIEFDVRRGDDTFTADITIGSRAG